MNSLPTALTMSRFVFGIIVAALLCIESNTAVLIAVILFVLGSLSDAADGAFARRQENPSKFGAFLDPIADKFLVFIVLISLVFNYDSLYILIATLIIITREISVMSLREWIATTADGKAVEVSGLSKIKTIIQMSGISLVVGSPLTDLAYFFEFSLSVLGLGALIGVYSAVKYYKVSLKYIR